MSSYIDSDRQIRLMMFALNELLPGIVCMNSACPTSEPVPHMASDGGNHPRPYGVIDSPSHVWRKRPWWQRIITKRK